MKLYGPFRLKFFMMPEIWVVLRKEKDPRFIYCMSWYYTYDGEEAAKVLYEHLLSGKIK